MFNAGKLGRYLALFGIFISGWGCCVAYISFTKINLPHFTKINKIIDSVFIPICTLPIIFIVTLPKNLKTLAPVNIMSIICMVFVIGLVFVNSYVTCTKYDSAILYFLLVRKFSVIFCEFFRIDDETENRFKAFSQREPTLSGFMIAFGISAFMMEGLPGTAIPIMKTLKKFEKYPTVVMMGVTAFYLPYWIFGISGLVFTYPSHPNASIIKNFPEDTFHDIVGILCIIMVIFTYPIAMYVPINLVAKEFKVCDSVIRNASLANGLYRIKVF